MTEDEFEQVILRALEQLPEEFVSALDNLNIEIRPRPSPYELEESCLGPGDTLFGLYVGVPLPDRTHFDTMSLPDQILIFQEPHEQAFSRGGGDGGASAKNPPARDRPLPGHG